MPGTPSGTIAFRLPGCARPRKPVPTKSPGTHPAEKEATMIKRHSDVVLEINAHDPDTIENDLNTAVEIARTHAMQERRHGILVTQHGYTSYTVAVSRDVPFGQTHERREQPANSQTETGPGR
jgi:hypothetical protein